jgi:ABC-type transport system substrate-binding protein
VNIWRDRLYGRETQGRPGAFLMGWSSFLYEAGLAWGWHASSNPYALWKNKAFDDAQDMANAMVDATERMKYYRLMAEQEKVDNGGPSAFIAESTQAVAFKTTVLDASSYKAWLAPEIYFNEVLPA